MKKYLALAGAGNRLVQW